MAKTYVAIIRDHSGSMRNIKRAAARDYNANVDALRESSHLMQQDTVVTVIKCGVGHDGAVVTEAVNSSVQALHTLDESYGYDTDGSYTPLFDSVGRAIELLRDVPDASDPSVSFLIMAITDGQDNRSPKWRHRIADEIKRLQATDRWTFAFRVPRGYLGEIERVGIPAGNILEWEQTERGFQRATETSKSAISGYYTQRAAGKTSVKSFYTDLSKVEAREVRTACADISTEVQIWKTGKDTELVREFCERKSGNPFLKGAAFYELLKTEPKVQGYKQIAIRDRKTGAVYGGIGARQLLGLSSTGTVRLVPGNHSQFDVFVQSTSVNRKLTPFSSVLYWPAIGVPYVEGVSSPWGK